MSTSTTKPPTITASQKTPTTKVTRATAPTTAITATIIPKPTGTIDTPTTQQHPLLSICVLHNTSIYIIFIYMYLYIYLNEYLLYAL